VRLKDAEGKTKGWSWNSNF